MVKKFQYKKKVFSLVYVLKTDWNRLIFHLFNSSKIEIEKTKKNSPNRIK